MSAGAGGGGGGAHVELKGLLLILLLIFIAWFFSGAKERAKNVNKPFLHPASPVDSGEEYGVTKKGEIKPTIHAW